MGEPRAWRSCIVTRIEVAPGDCCSGRLRFASPVVLGTALICVVLSSSHRQGRFGRRPLDRQRARPSEAAKPARKSQKAVETLINRLRGRDMPEGIVKTNGRLEATEVEWRQNILVGSRR